MPEDRVRCEAELREVCSAFFEQLADAGVEERRDVGALVQLEHPAPHLIVDAAAVAGEAGWPTRPAAGRSRSMTSWVLSRPMTRRRRRAKINS